ncbi:MAG: lysophospholipase [Candidatus Mesenet longicola]|uniref:Lysophospholipase n=1 Tax=Candidatus Mesenet longicola TaxID=1892558 RepID=A0A8J3HYH1_9RICK|nr:MAG: lysophospholipase [Candidatus Mesenet longicola]GHM59881.1 MAG: lysophospholipase [Candidatus Mesenet longicola]
MDYKNLYVLGDSLSDTGSFIGILNDFSPRNVCFSAPFYEGRSFSNGPLAIEYLANKLNLPLKPGWQCDVFYKSSEQIGTNYAISNASASEISTPLYRYFFNKFQLRNQLNALIRHHPDIGEEDLFIIMIGGNDIMNAIFDKYPLQAIDRAIDEIYRTFACLSDKNIKHIIVSNVPNIGLIPAFVNKKDKSILAAELTDRFDTELTNQIDNFKRKYTAVDIKKLDLKSKLNEIINSYREEERNIRDACISDIADHQDLKMFLELIITGEFKASYNPGCSEENICDYLFFDYFHPTAEPHRIIGDYLYKLATRNL